MKICDWCKTPHTTVEERRNCLRSSIIEEIVGSFKRTYDIEKIVTGKIENIEWDWEEVEQEGLVIRHSNSKNCWNIISVVGDAVTEETLFFKRPYTKKKVLQIWDEWGELLYLILHFSFEEKREVWKVKRCWECGCQFTFQHLLKRPSTFGEKLFWWKDSYCGC